ncbi:hypothetical protein ACE6H2_028345 [Prunus campanulata]
MGPTDGSRDGSLRSLGASGLKPIFRPKRGATGRLRNKFQVKASKRPRDFGTHGRMPSLKPASAPIFFPSSDLTIERGRKRRKKMDENGSSLLKQPREKALSFKSLI